MSAHDMPSIALRTVDGMDRAVELRASDAELVKCLVTDDRQSTTVPNTSVNRAFGGFDVDMIRVGGNC